MHWMATMKIAMTTRFGCNAIAEASSTFVCVLVDFSELPKTTLEAVFGGKVHNEVDGMGRNQEETY